MKPEEKRTYEVNPAVSISLRVPAESAKESRSAARRVEARRRATTFTPELIWRIIEKIREL